MNRSTPAATAPPSFSPEPAPAALSPRPPLGLGLCMAGFTLVTVMAYTVARIEQLDAAAMAGLYGIEAWWFQLPAEIAAHTGDAPPWLAALAVLAWLGFRWGRPRESVVAVAAAIFAVVASQVLKILLAHPRAQPVLGGFQIGPEALPSGHTTSSMSVAVTAVIVSPRDLRPYAVGLGAVYAWVVGVSLIALAWHLPSDVFAGMLLAAGCGFAALLLAQLLERAGVALPGAGRRQPVPELLRRLAYLAIPVGLIGLLIAVVAGSQRAGRALEYADAYSSAVAAVILIALTALGLLAALAAAVPGGGEGEALSRWDPGARKRGRTR